MNREWRMKRRAPCFFLTKKPFYCIIISVVCRCGEIGRHEGLKIPFWRQSTGSTPVGGIKNSSQLRLRAVFYFAPDEGSNSTAARRRQAISPVGCCLVRGFQPVGMSTVVDAAGQGGEQKSRRSTTAAATFHLQQITPCRRAALHTSWNGTRPQPGSCSHSAYAGTPDAVHSPRSPR